MVLLKRYNFLLFLPIFAGMISCDNSSNITFNQPQPIKAKKRTSFDRELLGRYQLDNDSLLFLGLTLRTCKKHHKDLKLDIKNTLIVTEQNVLVEFYGSVSKLDTNKKMLYHEVIANSNELDSTLSELFKRSNYQPQKAIEKEGLVQHPIDFVDTLFSFDMNHQLATYRGKYYLNLCNKNHQWTPYQLYLKDQSLQIGFLTRDDDVVLQRITAKNKEVYQEEALNLSHKSFKEFLILNGFENKLTFKKVE